VKRRLALFTLCAALGGAGLVTAIMISAQEAAAHRSGRHATHACPSGHHGYLWYNANLELGGSTALANLWPEAVLPKPSFHEEDRVENYLHARVGSGALAQAQRRIATKWPAIYRKLPAARYARLPLSFERNRGQASRRVDFLARGRGIALLLSRGDAVIALRRPRKSASGRPTAKYARPAVLRLRLVGADRRARAVGARRLQGRVNYLLGADWRRWHTNVPTYARVTYRNIYPGVDLVYYGSEGRLGYDFVVRPHADAAVIEFALRGVKRTSLDRRGGLMLALPGGELRLSRPFAYQQRGHLRHRVAAAYELRGRHRVGLRLGSHDHTRALVIDPVLAYSSYLGGSGADAGFAIALDGAGDAYLTGETFSPDFPAAAGSVGGNGDVFVAKLNASGSALVYATYLGGSALDRGFGIAVDATGNAYVDGDSYSSNFPTTVNALQPASGGGEDAIVAKLGPSGAPLYSSYVGGSGSDIAFAIALDDAGSAYLTGDTDSSNFPTTAGAFQTALAGAVNAFAAKLAGSGSALAYSTYLGGNGIDAGFGIAVDATGDAYLAGETDSATFPTSTDAVQPTPGGSNDAFAAKLNPSGTALLYSTHLGGSGPDNAFALALDGSGNAYLTGSTASGDFPTTPHAFQTVYAGGQDAFVAKLSPSGSALSYSSYLGGSDLELARAVTVDATGSAYVTGGTFSSNFPTARPLQAAPGGGEDAFATKLAPSGSALAYSTYLGGSGVDEGWGITVDARSNPNAYLTGVSESSDLPTTPVAFQGVRRGTSDAFITKISNSLCRKSRCGS
jgi:Beta-propeller repeat